jgi:hypothetical protein
MEELRICGWRQHGIYHCLLQFLGVPKVSCVSREHLMQHNNHIPGIRMDLTNGNTCGMFHLPALGYSEVETALHSSSSIPEILGLPLPISQQALTKRDICATQALPSLRSPKSVPSLVCPTQTQDGSRK